MFLVPFVSLSVLNILIYKTIRRAHQQRSIAMNQEQEQDFSIALMLMSVVVVFLFCNTVRLVFRMAKFVGYRIDADIGLVSNVFLVFNSSVNILLYCMFGKKFRQEFFKIFCRRRRRQIENSEGGTSISMRTINSQI